MKTILLTNKYGIEPHKIIQSVVPEGFQLIMLDEVTQQELESKVWMADYILASGRLIISEAVLSNATKLVMIQRTGVGLNSLDLDAIRKRNIPVYVNQGVNSNSVAEHAIMLILACFKKLTLINIRTKSGVWLKQEQGVLNKEIGKQIVGIIGMGNVGQKVAALLRAFGTEVLYYDCCGKPEIEVTLGINYVTLNELFATSDAIMLHCALTDENRELINRTSIQKMKDGVVIINTARGELINEEDLIDALCSGKVSFAGLDVFNEEPTYNTELLSLDNVIVTPHIAGVTYDSFCEMMSSAMRNIELFEKGQFEEIEQYKLVL